MSEITRFEASGLRKVDPQARGVDISVRLATQEDFAFIDALQKAESNGLGFMWEQAIRKRIDEGNMLVAEATPGTTGKMPVPLKCMAGETPAPPRQVPQPVGYCMGLDRYQKRSELGIIYQMAVIKEFRRMNVAGMLLQAQFDKSAYGTKLYCCWCKQSLEANRFWEAMGFVPLAFRAAGRTTIEKIKKKSGDTKGAVHIFWEKRIRVGDTQTPWWYPYETSGGAMMESRVILPLPPEVDWDDATPVVLPGSDRRAAEVLLLEGKLDEVVKEEREVKKGQRRGTNAKTRRRQDAKKNGAGVMGGGNRAVVSYGFGVGSGFGEPPEEKNPNEAAAQSLALAEAHNAELVRIKADKDAAKKALKTAQRKSDPELVAYARELRDRWQECVTAQPHMLEDKQRGKYAVGRLIEGAQEEEAPAVVFEVVAEVKRLDAA